MKKARRLRLSITIVTLALSATTAIPAMAMDYQSLLSAALGHDQGLRILSIKAGRADIQAERLALADRGLSFSLTSGAMEFSFLQAGLGLTASPSLSLARPAGPSLELGLPFSISPAGSSLSPALSFSCPLSPQGDPRSVELANAAATSQEARAALGRRSFEVEKELAGLLLKASEAKASLAAARRELEKARSALEKARRLDGLESGSAAALTLERAVRVQERKERDCAAALARTLQEVAGFCGLDLQPGEAAWDGLMPPVLPAARLEGELPPAGEPRLGTPRQGGPAHREARRGRGGAETWTLAQRECGLDQ